MLSALELPRTAVGCLASMTTSGPDPLAGSTATPAPAGALARIRAVHGHNLDHVDLHALLIEVWNRLDRGEAPTATPEVTLLGDAVCERLAATLEVHENRFSRRRFCDLFGAFYRYLAEPRPHIEGATFLDLGCGSVNPLGMSLLMCMLGAARGIGVDLDGVQDAPRAARGMARLADAMLQDPTQIVADYPITRDQIARNLRGIDVESLRKGEPQGVGPRLTLLNESAARLPLDAGSVDVMISNSFLEHIEDIDSILAEVGRVTAKGGFGIHGIDGVDHRFYIDKSRHLLDFLREPGRGRSGNSNRIRPLEYPAIFDRHGFSVQQVIPLRTVPLTSEEIAGFAEPWSTMPREMLEVATATVVTRKR